MLVITDKLVKDKDIVVVRLVVTDVVTFVLISVVIIVVSGTIFPTFKI